MAETSGLTLERIGERLKRSVTLALHGRALARVVEQTVDSLLQHTLLVAEDNLGSLNLNQTFQTVVTNDNATIEIVEVGRGETSTIQRHERAQFGRNNGDNLEDHPLWAVDFGARTESFYHLQALQSLSFALLARVVVGAIAQFVRQCIEV